MSYEDDVLKLLARVWRSYPKYSLGQLMAAIGNDAGMSVDNMTNAEIYAVLSNVDHNGMWGT